MSDKMGEILNLLIGLRKTLAWFGLMVVAIVFRLKNYVDGGQFTDLAKNTFLGFVAANGVEHISTTVKEFLNVKGQKVKELETSIGDDTGAK